MFRRQRSRGRSARSKSPSFSFTSFFSGRTRCSAERAVALRNGLGRRLFVEELEDRRMLTSTLYVDFGDLFPGAGFTGNLGTLKTATSGVLGDPAVRGPVMDGTLNSDWDVGNDGSTANDMRDTDNFTMTSFNNAFTAFGAVYTGGVTQLRADIMTFVRRFYEPFDIDVIELTSTAIDVNGRMVTAAADLAQISSTLGANETLTKNNDSYVLLGRMTVHRPAAAGGDFDPSTIFGGYASTADMPDSNALDNSALVYLRQNMFTAANIAGFFGNLIAHEAGHTFGFQHSLTATPGGTVSPLIPTSEIMSYLGGNGFNFFSRYPMVRGNNNTTNNDDLMAVSPPAPATNITPYDQWVNTPSIGANPDFHYITGTGAHDIITITTAGPNAVVSVQAFSDAAYSTALVVPGTAGASTTYSYVVSLDRPLVIDGGNLNDRIVLDGDLGTQILVRGMSGTDELIVDGKGASTLTYIPGVSDANGLDGLPNLQGRIIVGATTIDFQEFETDSLVTISDVVGAVRYELSDLDDDVRLSLDNDGFVVMTGTLNGADLAPVRVDAIGGLNVYGLAGNDVLTVDSSNGLLTSFPLYYDGGAGFDALNLRQTGGPTRTSSRINVGALPGSGQSAIVGGGVTQLVNFQNLEPISDNVPAATFTVSSVPGLASLLQDDNQITYLPGQTAAWGRFEIDNFEPIEFTNKQAVDLDAGSGDDVIVANNANTPTSLASFTINAGNGNDEIRLVNVPGPGGTLTTFTVNGDSGDDVIDASQIIVTRSLTLNGGAGNDTITGGAGADAINGGAGNDVIIWSPGNDAIDGGGEADALLIRGTVAANNATITQQAAANTLAITVDGANGTQTLAGLEHLRVELGDGNDQLTIDVPNAQLITAVGSIFYDGGTGANTLTVQGAFGAQSIDSVVYTPGLLPDEGRLLYTDGAQVMDVTFDNLRPIVDTTDAAELTINGNGSANSMTVVQDPAAATRLLASVDGFETISFNGKANFTLNGLGGDDEIVVDITAAAVITGLVSLRVNGNNGHDEIRLESLPTAAAFTSARADGGAGNDVIDASLIPTTTVKPLTLNGDAGNDVITGGAGLDTINGGDGDDTIIASPGNDNITGGAGIDQLHIIGTALADTITANQTAAATLVVNVTTNAVLSTRTYTIATLELARIDAGLGDDLIAINVVDAVPAANSLPFEVIGNSPNASDRLIVNDDGPGDLVIHSEGPDGRSGSVVIGPTGAGNALLAKPKVQVDYYSIERVDVTPLNVVGQTGTDAGGRLLVFKYDDFESNESISNATPVGLIPVYFGQRNIDPGGVVLPAPFNNIPGDADWYEFRPTKIGTFRFEALFEHIVTTTNGRPGLPGNGDLRLDVFRANGTLIASSNISTTTPINVDTRETVDVTLDPALTQSVFIRVQGASTPAINIYDFTVTEVDDVGPQVFDPDNGGPLAAIFPNNLTTYNLFDPKPVTAGPSPLIHSITINIRDLPLRAPGDLYPALDVLVASQPGLYSLVGDHVGHIDITSVTVVNNPVIVGQQATATITLHFAKALPDDRFTLTILDGVVDPPGNNLDGESNADEPGTPSFPSGNTIEGGDFHARFTVDTRPEIGAAVAADIDIDINGNYYWDPNNQQIGNDHTNVDLSFTLLVQNGVNGPLATGGFNVNDLLFAGKFTNLANGGVLPPRLFDQLAAFGYSAELGAYRWLIDTTGDGVITLGTSDLRILLPGGTSPVVLGVNVAGAIPIAGDFNNNAADGDEIGLYISGRWLLDTNHDFVLDTLLAGTNMLGAPVVGDFDGDGDDDLAVFNNNVFYFDLNRNGTTDTQLGAPWGFPGTLDKPIAADMDQDGIDDIGLWAPRDSASVPREVSEWYFLVSGSPTAAVTVFSAAPAGANFTITTPGLAGAIDSGALTVGQIVRIVGGVNAGRAIGTVASVAAGGVIVVNPGALNPGGITPAVGDIVAVGGVQNTIVTLDHAFNTTPFGNDIAAEFGDERALPIVGNFDPPAASTYIAPTPATIAGDFTGDSMVDGADFLSWQRNVANQSPSQNADDLADWQSNYGAVAAAASSGYVAASETVVFAAPADDEPAFFAVDEPATIVETLPVAALDSAALDLAPVRVVDANLDFVMLVGRSSVRTSQKADAPARDSARLHTRDAVLSNWTRRAIGRYETAGDSYFDDDWKIAVRGGKADAKRATPEELEDLVFAEF